jgi:hypothetical protein
LNRINPFASGSPGTAGAAIVEQLRAGIGHRRFA